MGNRVVLEVKPLTEDVERIFDFTSLLQEGETISSAAFEVDVFSGSDADPEAILSGSPRVESPRVFQKFTDGELGTTYTVTCMAGTCNSQVLSLAGYLSVLRVPDA